MEKEFVPHLQAIDLKDLGFISQCIASYTSGGKLKFFDFWETNNSIPEEPPFKAVCSAPLFQQAFRWFREEHNLHIPIQKVTGNQGTDAETTDWTITGSAWEVLPTYEEAELARLNKLIEMIKTRNNGR